MKLKLPFCLALVAMFLTLAGPARGQYSVPGPEDYGQFSRFIAERNIFNPDRYPHTSGRRYPAYHPPIGRSAPAFSFVGTMVYGKGMFAFFDGNNDDYRKSLQVSGTIAGYTVQDITLTNVVLAEGSNTLSLAVGHMMQKARDGSWVESDESEGFTTPTENSSSSSESSAAPAATDTPAAPSGSSPPMSDVLKRLMMLRQQENK